MITSCQTCGLVVEADEETENKLICPRCHSALLRSREEVKITLMLGITAFILMVPSCIFPFIHVQINEITMSVNVLQTANIMINDGFPIAGAVIFATALILPLLYLVLIIYISSACMLRRELPFVWVALRLLGVFEHFQMTDVFVLGILVSVVKLVDMSDVTLGNGFYFLTITSVIIISIDLYYDKHLFWCRRGYAK
jgi:paraquat-inducible protein A